MPLGQTSARHGCVDGRSSRQRRSSDMRYLRHLARNIDAVLLYTVCVAHVFLAPFTKVEESFNVQAAYDLLYKSWLEPALFDHASFPGVVPRTFLGPLVLYCIVAPFRILLRLSPLATFIAVRLALALLSVSGLLAVRHALQKRHSHVVGFMFALLTAVQFHVPFYAGRPLANVFALAFTNHALALRLRSDTARSALTVYALLAVAVAVLRSELCILLFWTIAYDVYTRRVHFTTAAYVSVLAAAAGAAASIAVDTHFWPVRAPLPIRYPELEVFHFNAVLGRSTEWGTLPAHWYFSTALPRALAGTLPLAFAAMTARVSRPHAARAAIPALLFVVTYSMLPHKELRFVLYALPAVTAAAAHAAATLLRIVQGTPPGKGKDRSHFALVRRVVAAGVLAACMAASLATTLVSTAASRANYPGAAALLALRSSIGCTERRIKVHIDAHTASTGVSQFIEAHVRCAHWSISREEKLSDDALRAHFTHIIASRAHVNGFRVMHEQYSFRRVDFRRVRIVTMPDVFVHERVIDVRKS